MFVVTGAAGVGAGTLDAEVCAAGDAEHDEAAEPWLGIASDLAVVLIDSDFLPAMLSASAVRLGSATACMYQTKQRFRTKLRFREYRL